MIYPQLIFILTAVISFIIIGYKKPELLKSPNFPFTRGCLGFSIIAYGASIIGFQLAPIEEDWITLGIFAQITAWIALVFVFRGTYDILSYR